MLESAVQHMLDWKSQAADDALIENRDEVPLAVFSAVVEAAGRRLSPSKTFTLLSKYTKRKADADLPRIEAIGQVISAPWYRKQYPGSHSADLDSIEWDARWLATGLQVNSPRIVIPLATSSSKKAITYLQDLTMNSKDEFADDALRRLFELGTSSAIETYRTVLTGLKKRKITNWERQRLVWSARWAPPDLHEELRQIAVEFPDDADDIFDALFESKNGNR